MSSFSTMSDGKRKAMLVFLAVIFIGCFGVVSIADLVNTKDKYTVNLGVCYELMEIEHSINGLIPVGRDYYYIGIAVDSPEAYILKGSKRWYAKNFDGNGASLGVTGTPVTGLLKRADYKVAQEINNVTSQFEDVTLAHSPDYSLELDYKIKAILRLIMLFVMIVFIICGKLFVFGKSEDNPVVIKVYVGIMVVILIILLKLVI